MAEHKERKSLIFKALRERIKESTENDIINEIAQLIGDRRHEDLLDMIVSIEQSNGWTATVQYLERAQDIQYSYPAGLSSIKKKVEPIKYREVLFQILGYDGIDSVNISTTSIFEFLENNTNYTESSNSFYDFLLPFLQNQILSGDTLFLDIDRLDRLLSSNLIEQIHTHRHDELSGVATHHNEGYVSIKDMWYTAFGFQALTSLGIHNIVIPMSEYETVLSVIPVSPSTKSQILCEELSDQRHKKPSNPTYYELIQAIVSGNETLLRNLGSKHAAPYFHSLLNKNIDEYSTNQTAELYRSYVNCIDNLISIRSIESITAYQSIINKNNQRLSTPVISALGNFYHLSSVETLIDLICTKRNSVIIDTSISALRNILRRCPQFEYTIKKHTELECTNIQKLKKLYSEIARKSKSDMYYE